MSGTWHGGKGSDQRPEAEPGAFARGFDAIDWTARERAVRKQRETESKLLLDNEVQAFHRGDRKP